MPGCVPLALPAGIKILSPAWVRPIITRSVMTCQSVRNDLPPDLSDSVAGPGLLTRRDCLAKKSLKPNKLDLP